MEALNINTILAVELLEAVFRNLSPDDLKSALLVCRRWRGVGEYSKLWSWVTLKVSFHNLFTMSPALASARLKSMTELHLSAVSQDLLEAIDNHLGLKVLKINFCDVSIVEPSLLAKIISKMEKVNLIETELSIQQCQEIFNTANNNSKLIGLAMPGNNLSSVDAVNLARVVTNLKWVDLEASLLTPLQCQTIFEFASQETSLISLDMTGNDLSTVNAEKLSSVAAKLEEIHSNQTNLTNQQSQDIFRLATDKLKVLSLEECDLSLVNPRDLALVSQLKWVNLSSTSLNPMQCAEIFKTIANASSMMEELSSSRLTTEQCNEIFLHLSRDSRLESLTISCNDLSEINPELMGQVISKLEAVNLEDTEMESEQCKTFFEKLKSDGQLKYLDMAGNDLEEVNPEDLARIIPKLELANLASTGLTTLQSEAIFKSINSESKIKKLSMAHNDLSSTDPELLATVITELEEVHLECSVQDEDEDFVYSGLTPQQCQIIFQRLAQDSKKMKKLYFIGNNLELVDPETIATVSAKLELNI